MVNSIIHLLIFKFISNLLFVLGLSSKICEECKNNAINAFKFRQLCISSDDNIRNIHCLNKKASLEHTFKREIIDDEGLLNDGSIDGGDLEGDLDLSEYLLNTHKESEIEEDEDDELLEEIIETKPESAKTSQRRSYSCSICGKLWPSPSKLQRHMNTHMKKDQKFNDIECEIANEHFTINTDPLAFKNQFQSSPERKKKFRCPICLKDWVSPSKLKRHMATHIVKDTKTPTHQPEQQQQQTYKSEQVESADYSSDTSFSGFKQEPYAFPIAHKVDKNYICSICNKTWLTPSKLAAHMQTHIKQEKKERHTSSGSGSSINQKQPNAKNICSVCMKVCVSPSKLKRHMGSHNRNKTSAVLSRPPRPKNYACPVCGKYFEVSFFIFINVDSS